MCASSRKPIQRVEQGLQLGLFGPPEPVSDGKLKRRMPFVDPDPEEIFVNGQRLDEHLKSLGHGEVLVLRSVLRALPWEGFRERYGRNGRPPYAPEAMLGGILYGLMKGKTSLRKLEEFFKFDVRVWWLTGGIQPDHSALGRFFHRHADTLSDVFFVMLTTHVLRRLGKAGGSKVTSLDATVIAAAGSRLASCKLDEAAEVAKQAREAAAAAPEDEQAQEAAAEAEAVHEAAKARAEQRAAAGYKASHTRVCTTEPDAAVLKSKRGLLEPGYLPSVLVNDDQIILAQCVEQTDEKSAFPKLLTQARRVAPEVETVLADGNYCKGPVLQHAVDEGVDFLSPTKSEARKRKLEPLDSSERNLVKADFTYSEDEDVYVCPTGNRLAFRTISPDKRRGTEARVYRPDKGTCDGCALLDRCPIRRRGVKRQASEALVAAMDEVLKQPRARRQFQQRMGMVEPVFAILRHVMGIQRFRRRGVVAVRAEYALYAAAYNLLKLVRALARRLRGGRAFPPMYVLMRAYALMVLATALRLPPRHPHQQRAATADGRYVVG